MHRLVIFAVALLGATACSSSKGGSGACQASGTYELVVAATGQSENNEGVCSLQIAASVDVPVTISGATASVGGQDCTVASTTGCQIEIDCSSPEAAAGSVTQVTVQRITFVLPTAAGQATENALVELGPGDCAFEGTAAIAQSADGH